jgi:hypothetical protein
MKVQPKLLVISILVILLSAGCIERTREALSPELRIRIVDHWIEEKNPDGNAPMKEHNWLYVKLNISNNNEDVDHDLKFNRFFLGSWDDNVYWCLGIMNNDTIIEKGAQGNFVLYFEIPEGAVPEWIEYTNTMGKEYRAFF